MPALLIRRGLLVLAVLALPAFGQGLPGPDDLRALRYYIQENETAATAAELRRLSIEFPGWIPPDDLTQLLRLEPSTEIDAIYARISANDIGGARRLLVETQAKYPNWSAPADLLSTLQTAEAQIAFDRAISARDIGAAVQAGVANPDLLRCNRINNPWRLAELQVLRGNTAAALTVYRQILATCGNLTELIATIEKANAIATPAELSALIATVRTRLPAAAVQLTALEERLLSGAQAAPPAAALAPAAIAAPAPSRRAATVATAPQAAPGSQMSVQPSQSPLLSLPNTGDGRIGSVRRAAAAESFVECTRLSMRPKSLDVAYERAWCVYNLDRPLEALALFSAAASGRLSGTASRDARYGMALTYLDLQMTEAASRVTAATDLTLEQRRTVEGIILDQRGVRAFERQQFVRAIQFFDAIEQLDGSLRRDLRLLRGYAYLNSGDRASANREFQSLHDELATAETRSALKSSVDDD